MKAPTIADLIQVLQAQPDQSLPVDLEGCDCTGAWNGEVEICAAIGASPPSLLLCRLEAGVYYDD
jgi:hypothetical protein